MQPPLRCGVYVDGLFNDPTSRNTYWTAEIAIRFIDLAYNTTAQVPPKDGDMWRINFSRVEWNVKVVAGRYVKDPSCQSCPEPGTAHEDNWVWSPQGTVNMHVPERWAMLQFATGEADYVWNSEWTLRETAMAMYYAQHAYAREHNGSFTRNVMDLAAYARPVGALDGICTQAPDMIVNADGFAASIRGLGESADRYATIDNRRLLRVFAV
jgi:hypothetical protein